MIDEPVVATNDRCACKHRRYGGTVIPTDRRYRRLVVYLRQQRRKHLALGLTQVRVPSVASAAKLFLGLVQGVMRPLHGVGDFVIQGVSPGGARRQNAVSERFRKKLSAAWVVGARRAKKNRPQQMLGRLHGLVMMIRTTSG